MVEQFLFRTNLDRACRAKTGHVVFCKRRINSMGNICDM